MLAHRHGSSYSLFPSCSDQLSQTSANKIIGRSLVRRISGSWEATDDSDEANYGRRNNTTVNKVLKQSEVMGRLIPLKLHLSEGKRSQDTSCPLTTTPSISTTSTAFRKARPRPVTDLIIIPYTEEEWKIVMEEVKILYLEGQYKQCSTRCKQILESIKDIVSSVSKRIRHQHLTDISAKHTLSILSASASSPPAPWK
jgi:hypothetical protein